jgi:RNA-directed DNA polymerase
MSRSPGRRQHLQRSGHPTYRLVRYADDLVVPVKGTREQAQALLDQLAGRVEALGLQLKSEKTAVTHIDEGFVFLGQRIVRLPKGPKRHVYTFVSNEALASARRKVKTLTGRSTTNLGLSQLIAALNPVLRGWGNYFRHAAAKRTLVYLGYYAWWRVGRWLREAPAADLEADPTTLRQRGHLPGRRDRAVQPRQHQRHALPLPGSAHPHPVEQRVAR